MFEALVRLNILAEIFAMTKAMYKYLFFREQQTDQASEWKLQRTGIRQGCLLNPFLFILTMHVILSVIKAKLQDPYYQRTFGRLNFHELPYADDTLLIAKNTTMAKLSYTW